MPADRFPPKWRLLNGKCTTSLTLEIGETFY